MFYAPGFDPYLIVAQIVCLQSLLYLNMGLCLCLLTGLTGNLSSVSLRSLFAGDAIRLSFASGWIPMVVYFVNALFGALALCGIVERAKKCLDFTFTFHFVHLLSCCYYSGFPTSWEWWVANGLALACMALLGEYLCMKRELQEIPLFANASAQGINRGRRHSGSQEV
mmetsp:Transcript_24091/g.80975  ORF Transcript_24091/g.80975 Transcript_24091/m.80975 type:complete len:168 (-) Transcript_24091:1820-2323(-)